MINAISHALTVLGWFEMTEEDRPPEQIWLDDDALAVHFERIMQKHSSPSSGAVEDIPDADLTQNELTAHLKR